MKGEVQGIFNPLELTLFDETLIRMLDVENVLV